MSCKCKTETTHSLRAQGFPEVEESFERNKVAIARIFVKHGFPNLPVNQFAAGVAYLIKPEIAADLKDYVIPDAVYNNAAGDEAEANITATTPEEEKADKQKKAADVLGFLGSLVTATSNLFGARAAATAVHTANPPSPAANNNNNNTAQENAEKKILGMSYGQAAIAAGIVVLLIVLVIIAIRKGKKG